MFTVELKDDGDGLVEGGRDLLEFNELLKLEASQGNLGITELASDALGIFTFVYDDALDLLVLVEFTQLADQLHLEFG